MFLMNTLKIIFRCTPVILSSKPTRKTTLKTQRGKVHSACFFSYLEDLATLDMYFRELIFKMAVDIEHFAKVQIMARCQQYILICCIIGALSDAKEGESFKTKATAKAAVCVSAILHPLRSKSSFPCQPQTPPRFAPPPLRL